MNSLSSPADRTNGGFRFNMKRQDPHKPSKSAVRSPLICNKERTKPSQRVNYMNEMSCKEGHIWTAWTTEPVVHHAENGLPEIKINRIIRRCLAPGCEKEELG